MKKILIYVVFIIEMILFGEQGFAQWYAQPNPLYGGVLAYISVDFIDNYNGWTVSDLGYIFKYDGTQWNQQESGTNEQLNSVSFIDKNNGWAVGNNGTIIKYKNGVWYPQLHITNYNIVSVNAIDSANIWFSGILFNTYNQLLLKYDGIKWTYFKWNYYPYSIYSLSFTDANHGWAVGGGETFIHNNNGTYTITPHYIILKYNGKQWDVQDSGSSINYLWSVCMLDSTHGWAMSDSGEILKYNGKHWSAQKQLLK